jgi:hypothetical protein
MWGIRLFRNNSGVLPDPITKRPVRFGLGNESKKLNKEFKSGDYIGVTPLTITPEMVGKTVGVFTNLEVKAEGFVERDSYRDNQREYGQKNYIVMIRKLGGLAGFVTNESDVDQLIQKFVQRLKS